MKETKCIQIVKNYIDQHGTTDNLEALLYGIENQNALFLDLIPTDLIKHLMPESNTLKWTRKEDEPFSQSLNNLSASI